MTNNYLTRFDEKIDFYTTSNSFSPELKSKKEKIYHHPNLNPNKNLWGENSVVLVRNTSGKDFIIRFIENGQEIGIDYPNYEKLKRWKYFARYEIIKIFEKDKIKSRTISKSLKTQVLEIQNNCCWFCGDYFDDNNHYDIDHIHEWSCGGLTVIENLHALCKNTCHWIKTFAFKKAKQEGKIDAEQWVSNIKTIDLLYVLKEKIRTSKGF